MDLGQWPTGKDALRLYDVVEDRLNSEAPNAIDMKAHELYITVVVNGEYEWYYQNDLNVLKGNYDHKFLTLSSNPPTDLIDKILQ